MLAKIVFKILFSKCFTPRVQNRSNINASIIEMPKDFFAFEILKDPNTILENSQCCPILSSRSSLAISLCLGCKLNHSSMHLSQKCQKISFLLKFLMIPMPSWRSPYAGQDFFSIFISHILPLPINFIIVICPNFKNCNFFSLNFHFSLIKYPQKI